MSKRVHFSRRARKECLRLLSLAAYAKDTKQYDLYRECVRRLRKERRRSYMRPGNDNVAATA